MNYIPILPIHFVQDRLPRELAPGVFWMGDCMVWPNPKTERLEHSYISVFVVVGQHTAIMIDTGHPKDWVVIRDQMDALIARGVPTPDYIFVTHPEVTHSGNLGRLLEHYPKARAVGDLRDLQLVFPSCTERFEYMKAGDEIDLGGRKIVLLEAVFRDLVASLWAYDPQERVLFSSDGMGFDHYHDCSQCGLTAEEIPDLPIAELVEQFLDSSLYWTRLTDVGPYVEKLEAMLAKYPVDMICAAHGCIITDLGTTLPKIISGLQRRVPLARPKSASVRDATRLESIAVTQ